MQNREEEQKMKPLTRNYDFLFPLYYDMHYYTEEKYIADFFTCETNERLFPNHNHNRHLHTVTAALKEIQNYGRMFCDTSISGNSHLGKYISK